LLVVSGCKNRATCISQEELGDIRQVPYDVTNTAVPSTPMPPWTIFEFGYVDTGLGSATAILYEINPCVPQPVQICRVVSVDNQSCGVCTFAAGTFNFLTNLYFVEVILDRPQGAPAPQACTLRIF
jgi:hypothetical protein